jgi:uncharacterized RDD family membrane protein YckC
MRFLAFASDATLVLVLILASFVANRLPFVPSGPLLYAIGGVVFVYYLTASSWLLQGRTAGKAIFGLEIRRCGGEPTPRTMRGMAWLCGRSTIGYGVIDVLGIGAGLALVSRDRRCLHDLAFGSQVVQTRLIEPEATFVARLEAYGRELEQALEDVSEPRKGLFFLWRWLNRIVVVAAAWLVVVPWFAGEAAAKEGSAASLGPAATVTPLPVAAQASLGALTTLATGAIIVGVLPAGQLDLAGTWHLEDVQMIHEGVHNPPEFEGGVLVIAPAEDGKHFVIAPGSSVLEGETLDPRLTSDDLTLAVSESQGRGDCVDLSTGRIVHEDVYEIAKRWEFLDTGEDHGHPDGLDRVRFAYTEISTKDSSDPGAEGCRDMGQVEITAFVTRVGGS